MLQVLGLARVGFCVADASGVILSADEIYSSILHYDHIKSGDLGISDIALPEDCRRINEVMDKVTLHGAPLVYRRPAICAGGDIIWVENRMSLLQGPEGLRFLIACREVDEPKPDERKAGLFFPTKTCAAYVADLAGELGAMAAESNLTMTSELLKLAVEMVRGEAETLAPANLPAMAH